MFKPLEVVTEIVGDNEQTQIRYAIADFLKLEQGTPPRKLYDCWTRLPRNTCGLPYESNCHPLDQPDRVTGILGSWVETNSEDPMDFIMREHAKNEFPGYGTELSDKPLSCIPDSLHAFSCATEYLFCKTDREPVYHEIRQRTRGIKRHYTRILLPVDGADGNVARVYYGVRRIAPPRGSVRAVSELEKS